MDADAASRPRPRNGADALALAGILLVAILVRIHAWSETVVLFNDGPVFLAMSKALGEGQFRELLNHPYHPLYPALIHVVSCFGVSAETAAVGVSILGAVIAILALHVFLRWYFGIEIAWLGAWLLALHPWAVDFSSDVMSDGLYTGLYLAAFAAMAGLLERPTLGRAICFGLGGALAFLVRPEGLGVLGIGIGLVLARMTMEPAYREFARRPLAILMLTTGLLIAPYVGFLSIEAGELTLTQKKSLISLASGSPLPEGIGARHDNAGFATSTQDSRPAIWLPQSAAVVGAGQPTRNLAGAVETVSRVVRTSVAALRYEVLLFVVIGWIVLWPVPKDPWRVAVFALPILLYSGVLILLVWGAGYVSRRHALAVWLPLLGFAALGWRAWGAALLTQGEARLGWRPRSERSRSRILCAALVVVLMLVWGPRDLRARRADRAALREAAEWISVQESVQGKVAAEKLRLAYYAGEAYVPLSEELGTSLESSLRSAGARWIVVDAAHLERFPPLVAGVGDWLNPVHRVERNNRIAVVFEIGEGPAR
jgi:4-amino-4-deoxy-L-arabinose transferase-like glycosyltransferase